MKWTALLVVSSFLVLSGTSFGSLADKKRMNDLDNQAKDLEKSLTGSNTCESTIKVKIDKAGLSKIPKGMSDSTMLSAANCLVHICWNAEIKNAIKAEKQITEVVSGVIEGEKSTFKLNGKTLVANFALKDSGNGVCESLTTFLMNNLK